MLMDLRIRHLLIGAATLTSVALTGCTLENNAATSPSAATSLGTIHGRAFGGNQPITGMHLYVYAAGTTGYGTASQSLLTNIAGTTSVDGSGNYYVSTDSNGNFTVSGDYTCTAGQDVYMYGVGGNTGAAGETTPNTAAGMLAVLGTCPSTGGTMAAVTPYVFMNEVTTVAAAYALSGFATDATHVADDEAVVGNTTAAIAKLGMANAFANAGNLVNVGTGTAYTSPPNSSTTATVTVKSVVMHYPVTVAQAAINTVADILATCVNSSAASSSSCSTLFANTTADGTVTGTQPTDTATAAINIAHNQAANVATLWGLINGQPAFMPYTSAAAPGDFTISIQFPNGGTATVGMAGDSLGNVFASYGGGNLVYKMTPGCVQTQTGASGSVNYVAAPRHLAVDQNNNIWVPSYETTTVANSITEFDDNLTTATGFSATDGTNAAYGMNGIAIAQNGDVWVVGEKGYNLRLNSSGVYQSEITGTPTGTFGIAINPSGNIALTGGTPTFSLSVYNSAGTAITTTSIGAGGMSTPQGVVSDVSGNFWVANDGTTASVVSEFTGTGATVSPTGYSTTGTTFVSGEFDGAGNYFTSGSSSVTGIFELNSSGTQTAKYQPYNNVEPIGYNAQNAYFVADPSGNLWAGGDNTIYELIGLTAPKINPIVTATFSGKTNWRP